MKVKCVRGFICNGIEWKKGRVYEVDSYSEDTITLISSLGRWYHFRRTEKKLHFDDARDFFNLAPIYFNEQLIEIKREIGIK